MIKVLVKKDNDQFVFIEIKGHANYDISGKDIVCAAVSSITNTTVNAILSFDNESIMYNEDDGYVLIKILKQSEITNKLLSNMVNMFNQLACDYKKNISIRNEG